LEHQPPPRPSSPRSAGAQHVLVVEDNSPVRALLVDLLHDAGYGVLQAGDGFEALHLLHQARPDLIVLDLTLPGMSGWQFLERSRQELAGIQTPVVVVSALDGQGHDPDALGVAAWLTKPLDADRFLDTLERVVGAAGGALPSVQTQAPPGAGAVLVIEDERAIRELLVEYLAGEGYAVEGAGSIPEAAARIASQPPALIVLDLMLPGRSGWDFLRERRADPRLSAIPVVVISAAPVDRLQEAKALGSSAFLSKPFDLDALGGLIHNFVR
jgi:CheY-like chemotaxis protein